MKIDDYTMMDDNDNDHGKTTQSAPSSDGGLAKRAPAAAGAAAESTPASAQSASQSTPSQFNATPNLPQMIFRIHHRPATEGQ